MRPISLLAGRVIAVCLAAVIGGGAVACGGSEEPENSGGSVTAASQEPASESPPAGRERSPGTSGSQDAEPRATGNGAAGSRTAGDSAAGGSAAADKASPTPKSASGASGEAAVERVASGMYSALAAGDAAAVCRTMSEQARDEIAAKVLGGSTTPPDQRICRSSMARFLEVAAQSGILERTLVADVVGVEIDGDTASATVEVGGRAGEIGLVREGGRWVVGAPPTVGR